MKSIHLSLEWDPEDPETIAIYAMGSRRELPTAARDLSWLRFVLRRIKAQDLAMRRAQFSATLANIELASRAQRELNRLQRRAARQELADWRDLLKRLGLPREGTTEIDEDFPW